MNRNMFLVAERVAQKQQQQKKKGQNSTECLRDTPKLFVFRLQAESFRNCESAGGNREVKM